MVAVPRVLKRYPLPRQDRIAFCTDPVALRTHRHTQAKVQVTGRRGVALQILNLKPICAGCISRLPIGSYSAICAL